MKKTEEWEYFEFYDHSVKNDMPVKKAKEYKLVKTSLIGIVLDENENHLLVGRTFFWDNDKIYNADVFSIIKGTIIKRKKVKI